MYNVELSEIEICRLASLAMKESLRAQNASKQSENESDKKIINNIAKTYADLFNKLYNVVSR